MAVPHPDPSPPAAVSTNGAPGASATRAWGFRSASQSVDVDVGAKAQWIDFITQLLFQASHRGQIDKEMTLSGLSMKWPPDERTRTGAAGSVGSNSEEVLDLAPISFIDELDCGDELIALFHGQQQRVEIERRIHPGQILVEHAHRGTDPRRRSRRAYADDCRQQAGRCEDRRLERSDQIDCRLSGREKPEGRRAGGAQLWRHGHYRRGRSGPGQDPPTEPCQSTRSGCAVAEMACSGEPS
jgi:hypothetical protein